MQQEIKSKSILFKNIIKDIDDQLSTIPLRDHDGMNIEDSGTFDDYVDAINDSLNKIITNHEPNKKRPELNLKEIAQRLIEDELMERREDEDEEEMNIYL